MPVGPSTAETVDSFPDRIDPPDTSVRGVGDEQIAGFVTRYAGRALEAPLRRRGVIAKIRTEPISSQDLRVFFDIRADLSIGHGQDSTRRINEYFVGGRIQRSPVRPRERLRQSRSPAEA